MVAVVVSAGGAVVVTACDEVATRVDVVGLIGFAAALSVS